jgi:TP901 family phage tail tape measure protein
MAGIRADVNLNVNTTQAKRSMDRAAAEINKVVNGIGGKQVSFNVNSRSFTQPLGRINASANEFTKSLEASNARVIAFGASVGIINGISDAFKGLVAETIKFEKTLTDINVVLNASAQSLERFGRGLFDVAKNTAQSFNVSAEAALEFSRQGLTMEEVLSRTNDALTLTRLTGLKAAEAVSGLTAAVNAFGGAGLTTTDIIDKLAAVDVKFAVSSEDLINALERTGAVAIDAGVEIDSLIGLVTALQQTTARGGAVIGNGLKTIFTRIQRPESIRQLEEMGLAVRDLSGAILPADRLMLGMAKSFDKLTQSQQSNIVQFSAGIFQANVFRAALRDLAKEQSIQAQATEIAGNASGDAAKKNEILNQTMSAMASQTATSLQELAETIGKLTLTPEIGGLLSFLQDGIEGIQNMLGGGEEKGNDFAIGLVRGIGNVLTGPAAVAFGAIFIKLFVNISKFASTSLKDVLGIVSEKDKIKQMEESITKALSENLKIQEGLNNLEGDRKAQEQFILGIIEKQNQAMAEQAQLASRLARPLVQAGVNPDFSQSRKTASSGVVPESAREEVKGAAKGGYRAGKVDSMNIPGMGEVVYNKAEKVKRFPGMRQPAIMPPEQSKAGRTYKDAFAGQHGFDPYASGGFIPNYALEAKKIGNTNILQLPKAKMFVETSDQDKGAGSSMAQKMKGWRSIEVPIRNLKNEMPSYSKHLSALEELGFDVLKRSFYFSNVDSKHKAGRSAYKAGKKDPKRVSYVTGKAYEQALSKSKMLKGKGYKSTQKAPDAKLDFISKGRMPLEAKYGSSQKDSLMSKSIRLSGDKYIEQFLAKSGFGDVGSALSKQKLEDSKEILRAMKLGSSDTDVQAYKLSGGFIPSFNKKQKIQSITGIKDGDSIDADVVVGVQNIDHRLKGIDAVEKDQPFGTRATTIAKNYYGSTAGKKRLESTRDKEGKAAYRRGVFDDADLSEELVVKGFGVPDRRYLTQSAYKEYDELVKFAQKRKVGMWGKNHQINKGTKENPSIQYTHNKAKLYTQQNKLFSKGERAKNKLRVGASFKKQKGYGSSGYEGIIPNFIDTRSRQQKIQDVLRDPANKGIKFKGGNLGTMSIKSKNMFHQMFLESYVNKGLKSDYDMLVKMGYDPKKINAARKHKQKGGKVNVLAKGHVPNFAMSGREYSKFSNVLATWSRNNAISPPIKSLSSREVFKIPKRSPLLAEEAIQNIRQFISSNEFRSLDPSIMREATLGYNKATSGNLSNPFRPFAKHSEDEFEGGIEKGRPMKKRAVAGGLVPNFANPLGDAVSREKAAGVPSSKIRIERSNELKSSQNPMGLAVTNTRDEPMGVSQGIKRAKSMGIDPKKHGASSGLIPNFVDYGPGMPAPKIQGPTYSDVGIKKEKRARDESTKSIKENAKATDRSTDSSEQNSMQSVMSLQRLFLFQSGLSMANGFLEQFAKEGSGATKTLAELGMAATNITGAYIQQKTVVSELMESFDIPKEKGIGIVDSFKGVATKEGRSNIKGSIIGNLKKGGDASKGVKGVVGNLGLLKKGIGAAAKGLLRFTPLIGQLYTGFTVLNEGIRMITGQGIMDHFASETTKAAKRLEKLSESSEKLSSALQNAQKVEDQSLKIAELELMAGNRTNKQELELLNLKSSQIKSQSALANSISELSSESEYGRDVAAEFSKAMATGASLQKTMNMLLEAQVKVDRISGLTELGSFVEERLKGAFSRAGGMQSFTSREARENELRAIAIEAASLTGGMSEGERREVMEKSQLRGMVSSENEKLKQVALTGKVVSDPKFNKIFNEAFNKAVENLEKAAEDAANSLAASKNLDKEIIKTIAAQKNSRKETELSSKIQSQIVGMQRKEKSFLRDILSEYGGISATTKIQEDSLDKLNKIQEDYNAKADSINNKLLDQAQDELNKRFKGDQESISNQLSKKTFKAGGDFELTGADAKILNELNASLKKEKDVSKKRLMIAEADLKGRQALAFTSAANGEMEGSLKAQELEKFKKMLKDADDALMLNDISFKAQKESVEQETKKANINKKTVIGLRELEKIMAEAIPYAEEQVENMKGNAGFLKIFNDRREKDLPKVLESSALIEEANEIQRKKNMDDTEAAKKSLEQLNYQIQNFQKNKKLRELNFKSEVAAQNLSSKELKERLEIFSKTKDYKDLITNKLEDEITQAGLAETDAQLKNEFYNIEKNRIDLVTRQTSAEILNLNTTNLINQEKIKQLAEQGKITQLVREQITQSKISATGDLQVAREKFQQTGSPEDGLALAQAMTALNKEFGNNTRGADMLREKLAELSERSANLSADLVNIGFDQTRSGLKDLFKSIGSGAKSASEAWSDFGLSMADTLLDRIMEHNIDKMISNLSTAFFGQDLLKDSNLLLRDSNLILKDSIDLNTAALSAQASVPFRQYAKGGFVDGPAGVDKVPAMLTAGEYVIPKDQASQLKQGGGLIQYFKDGTGTKGAKEKREKSRIMRGVEGVAQSIVMSEVSRAVGKSFSKKNAEASDSPPVFDKNKLNNLDLKSDVNIKKGDPRLSAKLLTQDPVMQEYKDYLLEKAAYDVKKNNEKLDKKMQTIGSIVSTVTSVAAAQLSEVAKPYIAKGVRASENFAKGTLGFGKHAEDYRAAKHKGLNVDYRAIKEGYRSGEIISNDNIVYNFDDFSKNEYKTEMHRAKGNIEKSIAINNKWSRKGRAIHRQSGGSIPAMLTAGEGFIPAPIAKRIGYENLSRMNTTGELPIVQGKGGVDNVGPVGLTEGDFIIKKSSTDKLLRDNPNMMRFALQNPDGFKRGESGYYEGGVVGKTSTAPSPSMAKASPVNRISNVEQVEMMGQPINQRPQTSTEIQKVGQTTNNINVNVTIDQAGGESISTDSSAGSYEEEQQLSLKIKSAVLDVIRQEKRIGGELSS